MAGGWPKLGEARGKVIFAVDLSPEANKPYAEGHPSLQGRAAFMTTFPDAPEAAYFTMNEPVKDQALIQERVKQGFLVRTRADADTREARVAKRLVARRLSHQAHSSSRPTTCGPTSASETATRLRCLMAPPRAATP